MKTRLLPLVSLFLIIFSCKDVEEPSPNSRIEGTYEFTSQGNKGWGDVKYNFVDLLEFKSNGIVSGESYTTEIGSDEILGYRGYFSGTYMISEGVLTISYDELYYMNLMDANFSPKEDLVVSEGADSSLEYRIAEDYSNLSFICPPYANCAGTLIYKRID
ncbi:hypothetical protein [Algoriphagus aquimarinus]|uniref:Lipocalin-like domain-containing protein n=1 Tax=Algoriphagus aquimarinus TaxID=237018 RepID=A0A1I0Z967_9BACT|nr:hypothetical protein [Algoriphagus aquimarinus]SFB20978.1 hypothetical protein SAMN04489723_105275 [Algoriphagus aquimarinus]